MSDKSLALPGAALLTKTLDRCMGVAVDFTLKVAPTTKRSEEEERLRRESSLHALIETHWVGEELKRGIETLVAEIDRQEDVKEYLPVLQNLAKIGAVLQVEGSPAKEGEPRPMQELLGISNSCMELIFRLAKGLFEKGEYDHAFSLASLLTILNPLVYAYWTACALSLIHLQRPQEALLPLAVATLLNIEEPAPRIWSAECYLAIKDVRSAKEELKCAEELVKSRGLDGWDEAISRIKNYIGGKYA